MLEDINNILNAGDVPNLYAPEDLDAIMSACRWDGTLNDCDRSLTRWLGIYFALLQQISLRISS